jgi:hypothetical protein
MTHEETDKSPACRPHSINAISSNTKPHAGQTICPLMMLHDEGMTQLRE